MGENTAYVAPACIYKNQEIKLRANIQTVI